MSIWGQARPSTFQVWGKLPFDKLRVNGQAASFALSREPGERSKGEFAPNLKYASNSMVSCLAGSIVLQY
jgi:hypothetical protein